MSFGVDFRVGIVGPGCRVIPYVFHSVSHGLVRLAQADVRSITPLRDEAGVQALAQERAEGLPNRLVDPLSKSRGKPYICFRTNQEQSCLFENAITGSSVPD
jgi:hypothetical protein